MDIGLIHRFAKGYEEGAKSVNPNIRVLANYVGVTDAAWNNPGRGKELALAQIAKGADVIFTGGWQFRAGRLRRRRGEGQRCERPRHAFRHRRRSNQNMVKPGFVLTSMVKRVDNAVYQIVQDVTERAASRRGCTCSGSRATASATSVDEYNQNLLSAEAIEPPKRRSARSSRAKSRYRCDVSVMLQLRDITKRFGGVLANDHINIYGRARHHSRHRRRERRRQVDRDAYRLWLLHGRQRRDSRSTGRSRRIQRPLDAIALGIGMVHQHFMLVDTMTVAENIVLGAETGTAVALDLDEAPDAHPSAVRGFQAVGRSRRARRDPVGRPAAAGRAAEGAVPKRAAS